MICNDRYVFIATLNLVFQLLLYFFFVLSFFFFVFPFVVWCFSIMLWSLLFGFVNLLATWCKELTPSKRPWCWERLKAGGEGDDRGCGGWMASPAWCKWIWVSSNRSPGVLPVHGVTNSWTRLSDWTELNYVFFIFCYLVFQVC